MAKVKKVKEVVTEVAEPIIEETKNPEIGEEPTSVILDDIKEVEGVTPLTIDLDKLEKVALSKGGEYMSPQEVLQMFNETGILVGREDLSMEKKILNFIDSREGDIKMNDFLKSLFGVPKLNEPPKWLNQGENKILRVTLDKMKKDGLINIQNDSHLLLGTFYYPDSATGKTHYHNLNTVHIVAKK